MKKRLISGLDGQSTAPRWGARLGALVGFGFERCFASIERAGVFVH
jgi:hypothetical protein